MKRSISIYSACLLMICVLAGTSCKKILEQTPKNATYDGVFWKTGRDYNSALAGNYALLRDAITNKNNRYFMYGDAIAKNYFTIDYTGDGLEGIQNGTFTFQYNVNTLGNWTMYYKTITMSNLILKRLSEAKDADFSDVENVQDFRNRVKGQALFLRGLSYFMMTRVWGDLPLVTEYYENPIEAPQLPRSPAADVWKQIENDAREAGSLLQWGYNGMTSLQRAVTANRGSAYALLTHLYLWRATMSNLASNTPDPKDVASADTTLTRLLTEGGYNYTDTTNYYTTFIGRTSNSVPSPEGIFQVYMDEKTQEGSASHIGLEFLRSSSYVSYFGNNARMWVPTTYFSRHYSGQTKDVRYRRNFDYIGTTEPMCRKYSNVSYRNPAQSLDAYLSNDIVIFRYSDMKLLQAEIALYKNDLPKAVNVINEIRFRNNNTDTLDASYSKDDLMYEYVVERGRELYLEGHIFYDLLRTRMVSEFVDWMADENRFKAGGFYWPVDPLLFQNNKLLIQTSYWLGKI